MKYRVWERNEIPRDHVCCYNCSYMQWLVGIGQGIRCAHPKNEYRFFREARWGKPDLINDRTRPKLPVIPGIDESCENFLHKDSFG